MTDSEILRYETKKFGKIWQVVRVWYGGWFPVNPVKGVDFRGRD